MEGGAGPAPPPIIALVLVQVKLVSKVTARVLKEACATVDPALLYHVNRVSTRKAKAKVLEARRERQAAFMEALKSVPVIRMVVVAGGKSGKVEVGKVTHGRAGAQFTEDLLIVVAGKKGLHALFGAGPMGAAVAAITSKRDDGELLDLPEDGYDAVAEQ